MRRALPLIGALTVLAAACASPRPEVRVGPAPEGFVPVVVDADGNVGHGLSLSVDADGNPHLAYLALEEEPEEGQAPQPQPGAPTLPAVKHAHLVQHIWTRNVVAEEQSGATVEDGTAIAVDEEGVHHVAWTAGGTLLYSANPQGEFSEPEEVASGVVGGVSLAAEGGRVVAAFRQSGGDAEGPGSLVRVATREDGAWTVETAAESDADPPDAPAVGLSGRQILVAYGDGARTMLARSGEVWESEVADQRGGIGVDISVDGDGNPHLSYRTADGEVRHAHTIAGAPWQVSTVADSGGTGSTAIVVDGQGVHHVAWETDQGIAYATNEGGDFAEEEVSGAEGGVSPRLGTGAEEAVYLAWFDADDAELQMGIRSDREPLLAAPAPSPGAPPTPAPDGEPTGPPPCLPDGTSLQIAAPPGAVASGFDQDCLASPMGEAFTVELTNDDSAPHNLSIYRDSSAAEAFFQGDILNPGESLTYEVDAIGEEGQFFFRCDLHPTTMTGTFVVQ